MNKSDIEVLSQCAVREIPGFDEFTEEQKNALSIWYAKSIENDERRRSRLINRSDSKSFAGLIPIAVFIGLHYAKWNLSFEAIISVVASYLLCAVLFFVCGKLYETFVINKNAGMIGTIVYVVIACIVCAMVGLYLIA